ncbi:hypothetical protein C8A00DRAFT_45555 [Chaetomidium leptoderma]|uniref:PNPLA domain-containing protein n=1 Tax=Chaetomidium leptoderma TaxID=669021 RepID=A0AAN6VHG2_9PEZI|nr:hypothetical protein C8A00DRAFT_45555 [Chaetomidium leptoderma]
MVQIKEIRGLEEVPKPCEYFHMIGGTSTGGLLAIMLGRLRMSTEEALREYDQCAMKIFSSQNRKWTTATEKFRATALKEVVKELVRRRDMGDEMKDDTLEHDSKGQCFVCVMPAKEVGALRRLRSYDSELDTFAPGIKIWEAARATTAASYYFKPMPLRVGNHLTEEFIDAAIGCNNPVEYLLKEAADRIGGGRRLGCLISIGTGTRLVKISRAATGLRNIGQLLTFGSELLGTLKNTATDSEEAHRRTEAKLGHYSNAYFRFNVPDVAAEVSLHEYLKMDILKTTAATYLSEPLVASRVLAVATALKGNSSEHGLTLGHIDGIDKDQVILSTQEAQPLGNISRFFTGRDDILDKLDACFSVRDTRGKPRREFLLYGMGGVGKTQTALKAADDLENRFEYIFHVDGTDALTAKQSYAKICDEYCGDANLGRGTTDEMKDVALRWIERLSDEWLMVYDNHPDKEHLQPILPRRSAGNIIYTSRSQGFRVDLPVECVCEIKPLAEEDAVNLLLRIAGREHFRSDEEEMKSARELVAKVGYLPLAIESAGTYIREGGFNAFTYLQRFRNRELRSTLLSNPNSDGSSPARPGLYTALDLSYDAISALRRRKGHNMEGRIARCALQALNLLCFYHNEEIPAWMIERAATERLRWGGHGIYPLSDLADTETPDMDATRLLAFKLPEGTWDDTSFFLGVQMLQRFSLVKLSPGRRIISMHVMVQEWVLNRIENMDKLGSVDKNIRGRQALAARIVLIESIRPEGDRLDQMYLRLIAPHVNACLAHKPATVDVDEYQAHLDFKLGWFYQEEKQFSSAVEHLVKAVRVWKFETGPYSWTTTLGLGMLANVYREMGRSDDAEMTYREVIDRLFIRKDQALVDLEASVAREHKRSRREAKRQKLDRLRHLRNSSGRNTEDMNDEEHDTDEEGQMDQPSAQGTPNPVANTAGDSRPTAKAEEQAVKGILSAAAEKQAAQDPGDETLEKWEAELADVGADLAMLLFDQGRFSLAKTCILQSISIYKRASYPQDFRIWALEDELKLRLEPRDLGHWSRRSQDMKALSPDMRALFQAHECNFLLPMGFATAMLERDRLEDAYDIYKSAFKNTSKIHGASDRRTLKLMRQMALCQLQRGAFEEAEELTRTVLARAKTSYGQYHLQTAESLYLLSTVRMCQTLDLGPGSEFWSITQEAYDSARFACWDEHRLAVLIKKRLDTFGDHDSKDPDTEEETADDGFLPVLEDAISNGALGSAEEFRAIRDAEYREYRRKKFQDEEEEEREKRKKWKGKGKANVTLSPILESGPSFQEAASQGPHIMMEIHEDDPQPEAKGKGRALPWFIPEVEAFVEDGLGSDDAGIEFQGTPQMQSSDGSSSRVHKDMAPGKLFVSAA